MVHDIEDLVKVGQLVKGLAFCCYSLFLFFCLKVCAKLCKVQVLCYLHFQVAVIMVLVLCQMMLNWYVLLGFLALANALKP